MSKVTKKYIWDDEDVDIEGLWTITKLYLLKLTGYSCFYAVSCSSYSYINRWWKC